MGWTKSLLDRFRTRPVRLLDILRRRNNRVARRAVTGGARKKSVDRELRGYNMKHNAAPAARWSVL